MRYVAKNADFAPFPSRPQFHRLALTTVSRRACVSCASIKPVLPQQSIQSRDCPRRNHSCSTSPSGARGPERRGVSATLKPSHAYRKTETRTLWRGFTERVRRFCNMKKRLRRARSPETPRHAGPKRIENREKCPLFALIKKTGISVLFDFKKKVSTYHKTGQARNGRINKRRFE